MNAPPSPSYDGGAPQAWAEALARLDPDKPPGDVPARRWLCFIDDRGRRGLGTSHEIKFPSY
jgi:hypothetical protein